MGRFLLKCDIETLAFYKEGTERLFNINITIKTILLSLEIQLIILLN